VYIIGRVVRWKPGMCSREASLKECVGIKSGGKERQYVTTASAKERQGECVCLENKHG
jgi:hypothetical protein